jgi:hypothetical protein
MSKRIHASKSHDGEKPRRALDAAQVAADEQKNYVAITHEVLRLLGVVADDGPPLRYRSAGERVRSLSTLLDQRTKQLEDIEPGVHAADNRVIYERLTLEIDAALDGAGFKSETSRSTAIALLLRQQRRLGKAHIAEKQIPTLTKEQVDEYIHAIMAGEPMPAWAVELVQEFS